MRDARVRTRALAAAAAALLLSGCGTRVATLYEKVLGSPSYARATESLTRTKEVHDGLDTRFILSATWLSPEWIRAFEEEYSNIYYLDEERKGKVVARWRSESERYQRFFVALFTPDEKGNDLEKPGTLWSLRLVGPDEKDYTPVYIRKSGLRSEEIAHFFPYSGTWYRAYEVAFPKGAGGTPDKEAGPKAGAEGGTRLKLVLTGVQGRAVLVW